MCVLPAAVICVVVGLAACGGGSPAGPESQQETTTTPTTVSSTPATFPTGDEPVVVEAGTYLVDSSAVASGTSMVSYTVVMPEGWTADSGGDLKKNEDTPQGISIAPWAIEDLGVYRDACHGELGDPGPAPASAAELVTALRAQGSGPLVADPVATTVGGLPATRIDLDHPDSEAHADCRIGTGQLQVWGTYFVLLPKTAATVYVVDVAGTPQVFVVDTADGASAADRAEAQSIIDSIRFEPVG